MQQVMSGWNTSREVQFSSNVLHMSVRSLDEGAVYKSNLVNGMLYDSLTVNHQKKMVYWFNPTSQTPAEHAFSVSALHKVLGGLQMLAGDVNEDYEVTLVMVLPAYNSVPRSGVCFKLNDKTKVSYSDLLHKNAHRIYPEEVLQDVAKIRAVYVVRAMFVDTGVEVISGK